MSPQPGPVAVTAAAVLTPLAEDLDGFTAALLAGRSAVTLGGEGDDALPVAALAAFDLASWAGRHLADKPEDAARLRKVAGRAALPARSAACVALRAVGDARLAKEQLADTALIVAGSNLALAHQAQTVLGHDRAPGRLRASYALTHLDVDVVGAVSELTGIRAEGWALGGASASGTLALIQAARTVAAGWAERALVVAPVAELSPVEAEALRRTGAMADEHFRDEPARMCRPFDTARQGFVRGEGAAALVLEHPDAARRRGARVLAEITGHGQRLDARRGTEPDAAGQERAMRTALDTAGIGPDDIDYVNAHGTGSRLGDATEAASLQAVFGTRPSLRINSTKPLTGHCLSAAGLIEAVATVAQLRAGTVHPNVNLHEPDTTLPLAGRTAEQRPLRCALSNSFAFGGINASVVIRLPEPRP
ncbi:beta-ketoacyl synthase N-terminal-like domain-containing protein [Streptomyces sp. NPDC006283]|uniref:beta-ketoacyl synthase N-terminal-like domain-containing protein n=1 Tax=Streptomyces sp. NPDC006283 TaxID=3156741 RepID=UPI0033A30A82